MAASSGAVRAGGAYVEIFAKDGAFQQAMTRVQNRLKATAAAMRQVGSNMMIGGAAMAAPLLAAVNGARRFEDALLDAKASAGLTAAEIERVQQKALALSKAGVGGPGEIAEAFTALVKAGMPLEAALDGAAEAVVKFATNAGLDTTRAAEIATDAMNVFGESTTNATDILKAAADSSSTNVDQMTQAFSQSSAVAGKAGQSMATLSAALAIMASQGIKGSDAGTSLKTMIQRLTTGSDDAGKALAEIGLGIASFRDARGNMLPLAQTMDILNAKLATLDPIARDNVMMRIFGTDAIRAANILTSAGSAGFAAMADQMGKSMTNADAFDERMSGITGAIRRLNGALERMSVAVSGGLGGVIASIEKGLTAFFNVVSSLAERFPILTQSVATAAGFLLAFGAATKVAGFAISGLTQAFSLVRALPALLNPVTLAIVGVGAAVAGAIVVARALSPEFKREADAIAAAFMAGNISGAMELIGANAGIVAMRMRHAFEDAGDSIRNTFAAAGSFIGDKLTEGLDRFMGLFGADILTLQEGWQKLGVYFKAAFDWKWALTGMGTALKKVDDEIERRRAAAPTADARAAERKAGRERAADMRGDAAADREARQRAELAAATAERDAVRDSLTPAQAADDAAATAARDFKQPFRQPGEFTPPDPQDQGRVAAAAAAATGIGQTVGTFSSTGEGLGIGPELNKLEQPAVQTAANTAATAEAVTALARGLDGRPIDLIDRAISPATVAGSLPPRDRRRLDPEHVRDLVAPDSGAGAAQQPAGQAIALASPAAGGVAAEVAAPRAPTVAQAARAGTAIADWAGVAQVMQSGFASVVNAIDSHKKVSESHTSRLDKIVQNTANAGMAFV